MVRITVKNSRIVAKNLEKTIEGFLVDTRSMLAVAKVFETELKGELESAATQEGKKRKSSTILANKSLSKRNKTSKYYSDYLSNIHFTGQLVSSIFARWRGKKGKVEMDVTGIRKRLVGKKGNKLGGIVRNTSVRKGLEDMGWRVLFVPTKKAPKRIVNILKRYIRRNKNI